VRSERPHTTQPPPVAAPQTASTVTTADSRSLGSASTDGSTVAEFLTVMLAVLTGLTLDRLIDKTFGGRRD